METPSVSVKSNADRSACNCLSGQSFPPLALNPFVTVLKLFNSVTEIIPLYVEATVGMPIPEENSYIIFQLFNTYNAYNGI